MTTQIRAEPTILDQWRLAHADGYTTIPTAAQHIGCKAASLDTAIRRARRAGQNIPLPIMKEVGSDTKLNGSDRLGPMLKLTPAQRHAAALRVHELARDATDAATLIEALGLEDACDG